jgi:positive regulator of sigma E activity
VIPRISAQRCTTAAATVTNVARDGSVEVELAAPACRGCEGACLWRRLPRAQRMTFPHAPGAMACGESVVIALPDSYLLLGVSTLYGIPLAALLCGAVAGVVAAGSDAGAVVGALVGVAIAGLVVRAARAKLERSLLHRLELAPLIEGRARVQHVDVDSSVALERRYGLRIPVLVDGDVELSGYPLDRERVARHLGSR